MHARCQKYMFYQGKFGNSRMIICRSFLAQQNRTVRLRGKCNENERSTVRAETFVTPDQFIFGYFGPTYS